MDNKRLTKPPLDDAQSIFKYGKECGIEQEQDRIVSLLKEEAMLLNETGCESDAAFILAMIDFIKGENE